MIVLAVRGTNEWRVLHFTVTDPPTADWTAQQIADAFPDDTAPSYLLRDRDTVYGHLVQQRVTACGSGKCSRPPTALGRIRSRSGSSLQSGASVWTMSSFSASGTSAAS